MAYDIYGNNLRRGYCEVHPQMQEEYPCSICLAENDRRGNEHRLKSYQRQVAQLQTENNQLKQENERLRNDLLDALDLKDGKGPTVLSMLKQENERLREYMIERGYSPNAINQ